MNGELGGLGVVSFIVDLLHKGDDVIMIETVEDAEEFLEDYDDWPPITSDPKVNYFIDQAMAIGPAEDWEDVKDEYESEVEHLTQSDEVAVIDPEEL